MQTDRNGNIVPIKINRPGNKLTERRRYWIVTSGYMSITTNSPTQFKGILALKLKDRKIEVLAVTNTKDPDGFPIETLTPIAPPMWAYFRQLSRKEVYAAMSVQATEKVQFVINWRDDITTAHVMRFRGVDYDITRVDTFEGYKGGLTIYAKKRG